MSIVAAQFLGSVQLQHAAVHIEFQGILALQGRAEERPSQASLADIGKDLHQAAKFALEEGPANNELP
jgi:hypothetical protein